MTEGGREPDREGAREDAPRAEGPDDPRADPGDPLSAYAGGVPDFAAARDHVVDELVRFVRALRRAGAAVPANAAVTAGRALAEVGFERERAEPALRAALLTRRADADTFDRLFVEFWRRLEAGLDPGGPAERPGPDAPEGGLAPLGADAAPEGDPAAAPGDDGDDPDPTAVARRSTGVEAADPAAAGEEVATATYSPAGSASAVSPGVAVGPDSGVGPAVDRLTRALGTLEGRRLTPATVGRPDARRALRESVGTGGALLGVPRERPARTDVRALLLVDVSRSVLDVLDERFLVEFLRTARRRWRTAPVFVFDEDVREVSDSFDADTADEALSALERAGAEWGGGTRIGHAIDVVRREHGRLVDRDTVVFVLSDGLEVGDLDDLAAGMAWLSRRARAVLWLNPLAASPEYEPSVRGMEVSLPYVDGLFAFAGADDVTELARQLSLRGPGGTVGYRQDPRRRGD